MKHGGGGSPPVGMSISSHHWHSWTRGMSRETGYLLPSEPPPGSLGLSLAAWAPDGMPDICSFHLHQLMFIQRPWMPGPGVTWGRACAGGWGCLDYAKPPYGLCCFPAKPKHVGGRRRVKEIPIYCSVVFIFTLGWFRAFFLMY